jgi:hypothetical protein
VALNEAKKKIKELEEQLANAGGAQPMAAPVKQEESKTEVVEKIVEVEKVVEKIVEVPAKYNHKLNVKSKPVLGYWNIRGLGAQCRYLLHYCGVEFEDKIYAYGPGPEYDRSAWYNEKQTLGLELPNLPYLLDDDIKMTETVAIMKYICAKWNPDLLHTDPVAYAKAEMIQGKMLNLKQTATMPCY